MTYRDKQIQIQKKIFGDKKLWGEFNHRFYSHVLKDYRHNFINQVNYEEVLNYFKENGIQWWHGVVPTNITLSSQTACINHLFPIRQDHQAVLSLVQSIDASLEDIEILENDEVSPGYISFEVVSRNDHLNEGRGKKNELSRGSQCTSIDAVILAKKQDKKVLIAIEWKYAETYSNEDKSNNPRIRDKYFGNNVNNPYLLQNSEQLKRYNDYEGSVYFFEPFYQLMRQTLWAEQMIKHRKEEVIQADDFIHVHVVPSGNKELLQKDYTHIRGGGKDMMTTWTDQLKEPNKYVLISPDKLFSKLPCDKWRDLICSLKARYWQ